MSKLIVSILVSLFILSCGKKDDRLVDSTNDSTFYVDKGVSLTGRPIVERDAQQKAIKKDYKIQACLKDNALQAAIQFLDFAVEVDGISIPKKTDQFGCIIWDEQINFDGFAREDEILIVRKIKALAGHAGTFTLELSINPWATDDSLTLIDLRFDLALRNKVSKNAVAYGRVDVSQLDANNNPALDSNNNPIKIPVIKMVYLKGVASSNVDGKPQNRNSSDMRMRLDAIQLQFLGHDYSAYEITESLNLKVAHKYRIRISPQFIRENFNGKQIFETIPSGNVKFRVALLKDTVKFDDSYTYNLRDVLSTSEFIGQMIDGVMVADVVLKFQDLAPLTGRTYLLLSASSEPGYIQFRDGNYISPLAALPAATQASFVPTKWSAELIHKNNMNYLNTVNNKLASETNYSFFKRKSGMVEISNNLVNFPYYKPGQSFNLKESLASFIDGRTNTVSHLQAQALCSLVLASDRDANYICQSNPSQFLNIRKREIVEKLTNNVPRRLGITYNEDLTINMNFATSEDKTTGNAQNAKLGVSASAGLSAGLDVNIIDSLMGSPAIGKPGETGFTPEDSPTKNWLAKITQKILGVGVKFPGFNLSLGGTASYSKDFYTWSLAESKKQTGSISTSLKFTANAEMKMFAFDGEFRSCLLVNVRSEKKAEMQLRAKKENRIYENPKEYFLCSAKAVKGTRKEIYVLINSVTGIAGSPFTDSADSSEAPLRLFFRGPSSYAVFKTLVQQKDYEMSFNKFPIDQIIKDVNSLRSPNDLNLNQEFPGLLNPVIE